MPTPPWFPYPWWGASVPRDRRDGRRFKELVQSNTSIMPRLGVERLQGWQVIFVVNLLRGMVDEKK